MRRVRPERDEYELPKNVVLDFRIAFSVGEIKVNLPVFLSFALVSNSSRRAHKISQTLSAASSTVSGV